MSKICILGDTHHGMRGDSLDFHNYNRKFYENVFFPHLLENGIDTVVQLGDLFDRRKFINFNSLALAKDYFFDAFEAHGVSLHTLIGNHDVFYKNTLSVNSPSLLLAGYKNIRIHDQFNTVEFDGVPIDFIPWICDENEEQIFEFIKNSKSQICFGHFEIYGFEMDRGNVCYEGIDKNLLIKYDMVLSGHFHHKSSDGHIFYVGTPGEMTWADYNDIRGFHIFDTNTRELQFIANPYKMFHKIIYDDDETDLKYWKNYDYESLKETFVKVVVVNKQNPYLFENVLDNLYKAGASDISIVEDFTDTAIENDPDIVDQAQDTMEILSKYIDSMTLNINPDKLKSLMREFYIEALNVERTQ